MIKSAQSDGLERGTMKNTDCLFSEASPVACKGALTREKQKTLRIVSYNIHHGEGMDGKIDLKRIADVIAKENPDLVALQEVDKNCQRSENRDIAKELGGLLNMEHRFGKSMDLQDGEYGNAVLSRLPILETIHHPLPKGEEPRCALEVKVQVQGFLAPISFISIHTQPHDDPQWVSVRLKQVQALLDALRNTSNPIVLAGDFNEEKTNPSLKKFAPPEWQVLDKNGKKTFPSNNPTIEIDFFILRGFPKASIQHAVIDERMASDHRPISMVITLHD